MSITDELNYFEEVSLLITHYNRSKSLEKLLHSLEKQNCRFKEIIVSDDGSSQLHLDQLQTLQKQYSFKLIKSNVNKGLGNNINKGQDAIDTPYTLYVQEDFEVTALFAGNFRNALKIMNQERNIDIVRLYAYFIYPTLIPYREGFSIMKYSHWCLNHIKFYYYSDHPHLRRSNFTKKFGRYVEGEKGDITEYKMAISFLRNKGKGMFFNNFSSLFVPSYVEGELTTMERRTWTLTTNPIIQVLRFIYLRFKFLKGVWDLRFLK
ncbi:glycosyltransferase [Rubrolithibacter danxiaensis]|uniref:glycosyltransferase n=1 Tax=Rubrolithibacter danxiaensis TaxID=3390805 RepID=UPI003BF82102